MGRDTSDRDNSQADLLRSFDLNIGTAIAEGIFTDEVSNTMSVLDPDGGGIRQADPRMHSPVG